MPRPKVFLDSCALLSAAFTKKADDSPARRLLRRGEIGLVDLRVSNEVLHDVDYVIRQRNAALLPTFAVLVHSAGITVTGDPLRSTVHMCQGMTGYLPDARVLAAAVECDADLFVTTDKEHFIGNPLIGPPEVKAKVKTPSEALEWLNQHPETETLS